MNRAPTPGPHGGDGASFAADLGVDVASILDLSASLNPLAPDVAPLVAAHLDEIGRYPDDRRATAAVAEMLDVESDRLILTNGGSEAISLVAQLEPAGWVEPPDFSLYERHLTTIDRGAPRWRSNPNNPRGSLADADAVARVWDEAFYVLATGQWSRGDVDAWRLGSLTKAFACPGLRIGYVIVPDSVDPGPVRRRLPRWSMNGLACAVVPELVRVADADGWRRGIAELRGQLVDVLRRFDIRPEPADANYVLVRDCPGLRHHLANHRILVRDTGSFGFDGVRIAVPDALGLSRFEAALDQMM